MVLLGDNLESSSQALLPKQEEENDVNRITQNGKVGNFWLIDNKQHYRSCLIPIKIQKDS